jgi:spore coat protein H
VKYINRLIIIVIISYINVNAQKNELSSYHSKASHLESNLSALNNAPSNKTYKYAQGDSIFKMQLVSKLEQITIDGSLKEYNRFPSLKLRPNSSDNLTLGNINDSTDCSANIWLLTDGDNLYFAGKVFDDSIINEMNDANIWNGDAVLFYFGLYDQRSISSPHTSYQTGSEPDYQMGISCTGLTYLWRWQIGESGSAIPDSRASVLQEDHFWTFELVCPLSGLMPWANSEFEPEPGMILPFNILIEDDDDGAGRDTQLYWMNDPSTEESHARPEVWGRLVFISKLNPPIADELPIITNVTLSSNILHTGDILKIIANVFSEDKISFVRCDLIAADNTKIDDVELFSTGEDIYENTWEVPQLSEQMTTIHVDITAVDKEGDSTQIENVVSFDIYRPILLLNDSYYGNSYKVFDDSSIADIKINIDPELLKKLFARGNEGSNEYLPASLSFKNDQIPTVTFAKIGFRLRGAIPRYCQKRDFKISLNEFETGRNLYGLDKINLRGLNRDPSVIREKICLDLLRELQVPASRASYVRLYINEEYKGLYLNVEEIDQGFLNALFGNNGGNLFKCAREAALTIREDENYKFTFGPPPYAPHQIERVYELHTNKSADDYSDLAQFINVLNNTPDSELKHEIEKILNVENFLKSQAVSVLVGDWDGYWSNQNNYYLYHNEWTGKFEFIPRDLDLTLGVDWGGGENATPDIYYYGPRSTDRPLIHRLLNIVECKGLYTRYVKQLIDGPFSKEKLWPKIEKIKSMIKSAAEEDVYRSLDYGWTINDFEQSFAKSLGTFHAIDFAAPFDLVTRIPYGLASFIEVRTSSALNQLDMSHIPPEVLEVSHFPLFPSVLDSVKISATIISHSTINSVMLHYNVGNGFQSAAMYDDGLHGDNEPADQIYGVLLSPFQNCKKVAYYVSARGNDSNGISLSPNNAPNTTYYYTIGLEKPSIVINEIMSANKSVITDEVGEFDDWIELYNNGNDTVNIGGMYLTDNLLNPSKWKIPNESMPPGEFLLIWTDGDENQGPFHTNFKLSRNGEQIGLFDIDDNANMPIDFLIFLSQNDDESYGRYPDGNEKWSVFFKTTPGKPNEITSRVDEKITKDNSEIQFALYQNYPNPFNPTTNINYQIPQNTEVTLRIYNLLGQLIITLVDEKQMSGSYSILWDGRNDNGQPVASGIYMCKIHTQNFVKTKKMTLIR